MSVFLSLHSTMFLPEAEIEALWKVCIQGNKTVNPKELDVQASCFQMKIRGSDGKSCSHVLPFLLADSWAVDLAEPPSQPRLQTVGPIGSSGPGRVASA